MRIAVALSGGVDSTAVARKLKAAGHEVVGLTMRLCPEWPGRRCDHASPDCTCQAGARAARQLGIRHELLDWREPFEQHVIRPFVDWFAQGLTPNPCAFCNRAMKFGLLLEHARSLGAEALATGHYLRQALTAKGPQVLRGADARKDQSYFVALVPVERFQHACFPLGDAIKETVQAQAAEEGWQPVCGETSTEICFLKGTNHVDFLRQRKPEAFQPGEIVDQDGRVLAEHQGLPAYTIGQRKGLGIAAPHPLYVLRLDVARNHVVVGPEAGLAAGSARLREVNWFAPPPDEPVAVLAQVRYRQTAIPARLQVAGPEQACLTFERPVRAITPGQVAAVYQGQVLLAGGILAAQAEDRRGG